MNYKSVGIRVSYLNAETFRKWLSLNNSIVPDLSFIHEKTHLIIPLSLSLEDAQRLLSDFPSPLPFELVHTIFPPKKLPPKSLLEILSETIPPSLHSLIPKSFDIIGDIAIVDIPRALKNWTDEIGNGLYSLFPSIKTVYNKTSSVSGQLRIRDLELIAGEKKCLTEHVEYSLRIIVDVCGAYFSPRLGTEHNHIASLCQDHETIIDLFTGVGPFPLHIAKKCSAIIYAIDINPVAIDNLKHSLKLNKLKGIIHPILGDCTTLPPSLPKADRVIMNLPGSSERFLETLVKLIKPHATVHFYHFVKTSNPKKELLSLLEPLSDFGWYISKIYSIRKVRESAPHEIHTCLDASLSPIST